MVLLLPPWSGYLLGCCDAAAPAWTWMTDNSINPRTVTPLDVLLTNVTRSLYFPGVVILSGPSRAYPLVVFPARLRTLVDTVPVRPPEGLVPDSSRREAPAPSCCNGSLLAVPIGRTATMTGREKETPGRTDAGGAMANERLYSLLELILNGDQKFYNDGGGIESDSWQSEEDN